MYAFAVLFKRTVFEIDRFRLSIDCDHIIKRGIEGGKEENECYCYLDRSISSSFEQAEKINCFFLFVRLNFEGWMGNGAAPKKA